MAPDNPYAPPVRDEARDPVGPGLRGAALRGLAWSLGYLLALRLVPARLLRSLVLDSTAVAILSAVFLDLRAEWRFRREVGRVVVVWEEHRLYALAALEARLAEAGVAVLARGRHHRALLYVFGPFVPIELLVPEAQAEAAVAALAPLPSHTRR